MFRGHCTFKLKLYEEFLFRSFGSGIKLGKGLLQYAGYGMYQYEVTGRKIDHFFHHFFKGTDMLVVVSS